MAALQPSAEGQGSPTKKKSFSQLFSQPSTSFIPIRQATVYKGEAAVIFSRADAEKLAEPFRWSLVGKFSHGRPSLEDIRKFFASLNLKDHIFIGLMDYRHVLIKCSAEADFNRIWTRGIWQLGKFPMRVFRWSREFHVLRESSLVPVWVELPNLPIHFFDKHSLFSILSPVGRPLFLDSATAAGTRPSVARVCVEIDVAKPVLSRIWVAVEGETGFWQTIVPNDMPSYCSSCWRLGHSSENCKKNFIDGGHQHQNNQTKRLKHGSKLSGNTQHKLVITNECNDLEAKDKLSKEGTIAPEQMQSSGEKEDEGITTAVTKESEGTADKCNTEAKGKASMEFKSATEEVRLPGVIEIERTSIGAMEQSGTPEQNDAVADAYAVKEGKKTAASNTDAHPQSVADVAMHVHKEHSVMEDQLTVCYGNDCEGPQILRKHNVGMVQHQMISTTSTINQQPDNSNGNNSSGPQLIEEHNLGIVYHERSDTTEIDNLYVELRGADDEDSKSNAADEVALPTNVGNLSPRLVIPREKSAEPSIHTLNIDQSVGVQMDCRQDRVKGVRAGFPSDRQLRSATSSQNSFQVFSHD